MTPLASELWQLRGKGAVRTGNNSSAVLPCAPWPRSASPASRVRASANRQVPQSAMRIRDDPGARAAWFGRSPRYQSRPVARHPAPSCAQANRAKRASPAGVSNGASWARDRETARRRAAAILPATSATRAKTYIGERMLGDGRHGLDDTILEDLAADHPHVGIVARLPDEVLSPAEADLQPHLGDRLRKERSWRLRAGARQVQGQSRQLIIEEGLLSCTQPPPTPAPERS